MPEMSEIYVGEKPDGWPADDKARFLPWPTWPMLSGEPRPRQLEEFLDLAKQNRVPRAMVEKLLRDNQLPSSWCPQGMI